MHTAVVLELSVEASDKGVEGDGNMEGLSILSQLEGLGRVVSSATPSGSGQNPGRKLVLGAFSA